MWCSVKKNSKTERKPSTQINQLSKILDGYDTSSLSSAKANWYFGQWKELTDLNLKEFENHPDIHLLAALKAAGHQQLGDMKKCKKYIRIARRLGCDNRLIARLLVAGVHNSLGKLAALRQKNEEARAHFTAAVDLKTGGSKKDLHLARHARSVKEMTQLGLLPQAALLLDEQVVQLDSFRFDTIKHQAAMALLKIQQEEILSLVKHKRGITNSDKPEFLVLIGSIPRSGSTWLYNCVRKILQVRYNDIYSCWTGDYKPENCSPVHLVKMHDPDIELSQKADVILSTRRDIREVAASFVRMEWAEKGDEFYKKLIWVVDTVHPFWNTRTNLEVEYSQMMKSPDYTVEQVGHALGIHISAHKAQEISAYLASMPLPEKYDRKTQLHPNHRGAVPMHYSELLGQKQAKKITELFDNWLTRFGYINSK